MPHMPFLQCGAVLWVQHGAWLEVVVRGGTLSFFQDDCPPAEEADSLYDSLTDGQNDSLDDDLHDELRDDVHPPGNDALSRAVPGEGAGADSLVPSVAQWVDSALTPSAEVWGEEVPRPRTKTVPLLEVEGLRVSATLTPCSLPPPSVPSPKPSAAPSKAAVKKGGLSSKASPKRGPALRSPSLGTKPVTPKAPRPVPRAMTPIVIPQKSLTKAGPFQACLPLLSTGQDFGGGGGLGSGHCGVAGNPPPSNDPGSVPHRLSAYAGWCFWVYVRVRLSSRESSTRGWLGWLSTR